MSESDNTGDQANAAPAADAGIPRRETGDLASFKNLGGATRDAAGGGSAARVKSGKEKKKPGRPTNNHAGFSAEKIDEVVGDPEVEAARGEFESVLIGLLVTTTDNIADSRYEILVKKYPAEVSRAMADKAKLTEKERKYFGAVIIRLWRKYLGDDYLFTDEMIASAYAMQYLIRNFEGINQARKIQAESNAKSNDKQSGLQSPVSPDSRGEKNGQINPSRSGDPHASSRANPNL